MQLGVEGVGWKKNWERARGGRQEEGEEEEVEDGWASRRRWWDGCTAHQVARPSRVFRTTTLGVLTGDCQKTAVSLAAADMRSHISCEWDETDLAREARLWNDAFLHAKNTNSRSTSKKSPDLPQA